ncbi:MAG: hypothetical protein OXG81_05175, partial [Acidobacteria bacterium]|nr:hypothetical protein [Acidobacteriota bacterium]
QGDIESIQSWINCIPPQGVIIIYPFDEEIVDICCWCPQYEVAPRSAGDVELPLDLIIIDVSFLQLVCIINVL